MDKRSLFTVGVLLGGAFGLSCVSPFYGTARIEKGWHMDAGIAATSLASFTSGWFPYCVGGEETLKPASALMITYK